MPPIDDLSVVAAIITSLGGYELVRYLLNRRANSRIAHVHADVEEFHALREYNEFLQQQLRQGDERYAEQTSLVRALNADVLRLMQEKANAEIELAAKRCEVPGCPKRVPPSNF